MFRGALTFSCDFVWLLIHDCFCYQSNSYEQAICGLLQVCKNHLNSDDLVLLPVLVIKVTLIIRIRLVLGFCTAQTLAHVEHYHFSCLFVTM